MSSAGLLGDLQHFLATIAIFSAPMNFLRHPSVFITLSDVFAVLCLVVMFVRRAVPLRPLGPATTYWMAGVGLLIGGLYVSSLFGGDAIRGMVVSSQYIFSLFLLPFVFAGADDRRNLALAKALVFSVFLLCVFGIYLVEFVGDKGTRFVSGSGRMMSFVERENECAALIAMTIPLAIWLRARREMSLPVFVGLLTVMVYGIMLTGSNTGVIALLIVLLVTAVLTFSWRGILSSAAAAVGALAVLLTWGQAFVPEVFSRRVLEALEAGDIDQAGTYSGRIQLMMEAFGIANNTWFIGAGADQYINYGTLGSAVHNAYLLLWIEGGYLSLLGLLILVSSGLYLAYAAKCRNNLAASACTLSTFLVFAFVANTVPHIYARFWYAPLLLSAAISAVATVERRRVRADSRSMLAEEDRWHLSTGKV